jgi:hypothetical protein
MEPRGRARLAATSVYSWRVGMARLLRSTVTGPVEVLRRSVEPAKETLEMGAGKT